MAARWLIVVLATIALHASRADAQTNPDWRLRFDAEVGNGDPAREGFDVRDAIRARPISVLGPDAFRYVEQPALGGTGYVIELRRRRLNATIEVNWLYGHPGLGWTRTRLRRLTIPLEDYDSLSEWVDEEFDRAERAHAARGDSDARYLCADGPGASTERISGDRARWMTGSCGEDHPNDMIGNRLKGLVLDLLGSP
jgi:hypothetical protein